MRGGGVVIRIDHHRCAAPAECRACLERCPGAVFLAYPETVRKPGRAAADWRIAPAFAGRCTGCLICARACPVGAIQIQWSGGGRY